MRVTIDTFRQCLKTPKQNFMTFEINKIKRKIECDENGEPIICRTTDFAEATVYRVEEEDRRYHLSLPLNDKVLMMCEKTETIMSQINSELFCEHRILRNELKYTDWDGSTKYMDILLSSIPVGTPLDEFLASGDDFSFLSSAVDAMEEEMAKFKISYNGLSPRCIVVGKDNRLYFTRLHTVKQGDNQAAQRAKEMGMLRDWITEQLALRGYDFVSLKNQSVEAYENRASIFDHHKRVSNPFEGYICVEDEDGFRYVDLNDCPIFDTVFIWASDFSEGRAEVEIASGMGLIDKSGRYIIPAEYDIVEYDVESGYSRVRKGDTWALFDYNGELILPFEPRYIDEEDIKLIHIK